MAVPPGQNPFFLSPSQTAALLSDHPQPIQQVSQRTALPPRNPGDVSALLPSANQNPGRQAQTIAPGPSNNQPRMPRQQPPRQANNNLQQGNKKRVNWGPWGNPIGDPGARLPWRNMQPGDPLPRGPSFSECVGRMNPDYRYPFPPPQPPRPGTPRRDKKMTPLQEAEARSRAKWLPRSQQDQGWRLPGRTGGSRGQWETDGAGHGTGQGRRSHGRRRPHQEPWDDLMYVEDLRMERSWGNQKGWRSKCIIM